ncbi:hypothetical protein GPX89_13880 [Nocardia sp. ET3-3]|uniref:Uncharacterized protein n=1 Tax=Nocardia terrae TaxID=2675851 RepID=A0A7K1UVE6_9NOCA|nr:hypothetical protein [Nocardia terrae]MVU78330.1 hypothetical protein [Nocardia terrae]
MTTPTRQESQQTDRLSDEVLESAKAGQRAASAAVHAFITTVDEAIRERREAIREDSALHALRKSLIEAGLELSDKLITAQYEFLRSIVREAGEALNKADGQKR